MKKRLKIALLSLLLSCSINSTTLAAMNVMNLNMDGKTIKYEQEEIILKVNGQKVVTKEMPPIALNGRTLVPAREMFEKMGAKVTWNGAKQEVDIKLDDTSVNLKINGSVARIVKNSKETKCQLEVAAKIINQKTMIPFRAVAEAIGCNVDWVNETRTILVSLPKDNNNGNENKENTDTKKEETNTNVNINNNFQDIEDEKVAEALLDDGMSWSVMTNGLMDYINKFTKKQAEPCNIVSASGDFSNDDYAVITIASDGPITNVKPSTYNKSIIFDIENSKRVIASAKSFATNSYVTQIRSSQYNDKDTRCVLDLKNSCSYSSSLSSDRTKIIIKLYKTKITKVDYKDGINEGVLNIEATGNIAFNVGRLTDSERIYIDVLNAKTSFGSKTATIKKSNFVSSVRTSQVSTNNVRVVLDTKEQCLYSIQKVSDNKIKLIIKKPTYKYIRYSNSNGKKLVIDTSELINFKYNNVNVVENYMTNNYEVNLGADFAKQIGEGSFDTNDGLIDKFNVSSNGNTKIKFTTTNSTIIALKTYMEGEKLIVEIVRPGDKYDKVLVLDAGHGLSAKGGNDPGACVGDNTEKTFNLDLALKTKENIESMSDIKVYMSRYADKTFAPSIVNMNDANHYLNGRAQIANDIKSDMFISIHNNSMGTNFPQWNGTTVLYNNSKKYADGTQEYNGLTNKKLATLLSEGIVSKTGGIYQNNMTEKKNGTNIADGISNRTDLAVLNIANMPASLIELGFMTNPQDLAKLNDPNYIMKASKAIATTIIEIFDKYKLNTK